MRTVVALARCSHFGPTVAVTTFATLFAVMVGQGRDAAWVAAAVLAGQLSVGWSNDWLDRHRDRASGRRDKPLVRGDVADRTVWFGAMIAVVACALLSLASGMAATAVHLAAVGMAWAYNAGVKGTAASPVPYAVAFGLLPVFVTLGLRPPVLPPLWVVAAAALLGAGAHFANAVPDLDDDAATGIRGLPHRIGATGSIAAATVLLGAGIATVVAGAGEISRAAVWAIGVAGCIVVAVPVTWALGRRGAAFRLAMAAAGGVVVALVMSGSRIV